MVVGWLDGWVASVYQVAVQVINIRVTVDINSKQD